MIDGVSISLGGTEYVVPALSFKQLRNLQPKLATLGTVKGIPSEAQLDAVAEVVHAALSRNYPDLTLDQVGDMLDLTNMKHIVPAIMGISGLVSEGEALAGKS